MAELPEIIRAFIALPIPSAVIAQLSRIQDSLKPKFRDVSWTRAEAMHLTLRFLGDIDSARVDNIIAALAAATTGINSFAVQLGEVGAFGSRVIWIGLCEGAEPLGKLEAAIRTTTKNFGIQEERDFNAHVTLGRFRKPERGVATKLRACSRLELPTWQATHIEFIRSELSPNGSRYTVLGTFTLQT